jgi:cobalt-zinc-cadmium efflux system membrane fusion protein
MSSNEASGTAERQTTAEHRSWRSGLLLASVFLAAGTASVAHEGHEPLPAKGVLVDVDAGTIALSRTAHQALKVMTAEVGIQPLVSSVSTYARLIPAWNRHAFAATGIAGRLSAIHVRAGDTVRAGQRLATIQSLPLETIQLELLAARAEHDLATRTLERLTTLTQARVATGRELAEAQARWRQVDAGIRVAATKLRGLGLPEGVVAGLAEGSRPPLGNALEIVSPIDGTVMHVDALPGETVQGNEHLFEIVDLREVWAEIQLLERDVNQVSVGQSVQLVLSAFPDERIETSVHATGLMLAPETKLGVAWATVANPPDAPARFLPGMTGQATVLTTLGPDRIAVPAQAVHTNGIETYVLVEEAATREGFDYRRQNVVVEGRAEGNVLLRDGNLFPGDQVVTAGSHELGGFFIPGILRLSPEAEMNIGLQTETAGFHSIEDVLEIDGLVDVPPGSRAVVTAQTEGRVTRIVCRNGQAVASGEILAEITSLEVLEIQSELIQAAAEQRLQEESLARLRVLDATQSVPERRVWETQAAAIAAAEQVGSLSRKLQGVGYAPEEIEAMAQEGRVFPVVPLRASVGGTVVRLDVALGQVVQPDQEVAEIHDPRHVWIRSHLAEPELGSLPSDHQAPEVRVRFTSLPGQVFGGRLARRGVAVDTIDRTLPIWVEINPPAGMVLQHNMLARVTLPVAKAAPVLAVPLTAIARQGTRSYLFIRESNGDFRRQSVELGSRDDCRVAVTRGLEPGEVVAVEGVAALQTAFASIR